MVRVFSQLLQFHFSVGPGSAAIFGQKCVTQPFKVQKVQKAEKYDGVVTTHSFHGSVELSYKFLLLPPLIFFLAKNSNLFYALPYENYLLRWFANNKLKLKYQKKIFIRTFQTKGCNTGKLYDCSSDLWKWRKNDTSATNTRRGRNTKIQLPIGDVRQSGGGNSY